MPSLVLPPTHRLDGANPYAAQSVLVGVVDSDPPQATDQEILVTAPAVTTCFDLLRSGGVADLPTPENRQQPVGTVLQIAATAVLAWAGEPGLDATAWRTHHPGRYVIPAQREELSRTCLAVASLALTQAVASDAGNGEAVVRDRLEKLAERAKHHVPALQTAAVEAACRRRGIPWRRITNRPPAYQLGDGARQCRLDLSVTSQTSRLATEIARDKRTANALLARFGLPVARQIGVTDAHSGWAAAQRIGPPVVVKPRQGNMGTSVSVGLSGENEVRAAVADAQRLDKTVLVESFLPGDDHRILVANGRIIAVSRRTPAHVEGDGRRSVRELVDAANADPRRSKSYRTLLMSIEIDDEAERLLAAKGLTQDSIPPAGEPVFLKSAANWTAGGITFDCTDRIHPDNAEMVRHAADIVGLDIAGVDLLIPDIARSFREVGGGICEVNYKPGILVHISADGLGERDIAGEIVETIQPDPRGGHLPTLIVCDPVDPDTVSIGVAQVLRDRWGMRVACHTKFALWLDGWPVAEAFVPVGSAYELAACNPRSDAAVLVADAEAIARGGLGANHVDVILAPDSASQQRLTAVAQTTGAELVSSVDPGVAAECLMQRATVGGSRLAHDA